jgi:3-oxoacyl-[acyl-carrier protein] reductase
VALDVTQPGQPERVVAEVLARWGRLDALVNNAGVTADALFLQLREAEWDRVLSVNLKGAMACARAAVWPMLRQRGGHIINIGSFAARGGRPGQAAYAAAKAGLIGLTQSLAAEAGSRNVRVNIVFPGVLATPMTADLSADALAALLGRSVLRRANTVEEVARFVVHLAGMENVSGQVFQLDSRPARWT